VATNGDPWPNSFFEPKRVVYRARTRTGARLLSKARSSTEKRVTVYSTIQRALGHGRPQKSGSFGRESRPAIPDWLTDPTFISELSSHVSESADPAW